MNGRPPTVDDLIAARLSEHVTNGIPTREALQQALADVATQLGIPQIGELPPEHFEVLLADVEARIAWWREQQAAGLQPVAPGVVAQIVPDEEYEAEVARQKAASRQPS